MPKVIWGTAPDDDDYPAAISFLSLLTNQSEIDSLLTQLHSAPIEIFKAKDVVRAAGLSLLDKTNFHVKRDLRKIMAKIELSPLLLVRGDRPNELPLTIADGYHRACAVYWNNEDDYIHAKVANWTK